MRVLAVALAITAGMAGADAASRAPLAAVDTRAPLKAPTAADEAAYLERFKALASSRTGELPGYDPLEAVAGARASALPRGGAGVDPAAVARAVAYAAGQNSSSLVIVRDGRVVADWYAAGRTAADTIVGKSLAKPLTAIVVGRAIQLGKIRGLDQPVSDFVTEWRGTPKGAMLVRHLLDMRSGLLAQGFEPKPESIWNRAYLHPRHEWIAVNDYPLTDAPGSKYEYSNVTSELVALVIERATGRRYAEFVGSEVLKPIGAAGGTVWVNRPGGLAHSGCCIMLPPETWARLGMLLADDGVANGRRLLPAGYVAAMRTATVQNPYYGLGVYVAGQYIERRGFANPARPGQKVLHASPYAAGDLFLFDGNGNQAVWIVPSAKLVIVRTGEWGKRQGPDEWDNSAIPNMLLAGMKGDWTPQPRDDD